MLWIYNICLVSLDLNLGQVIKYKIGDELTDFQEGMMFIFVFYIDLF
jgi:hypothetical protein